MRATIAKLTDHFAYVNMEASLVSDWFGAEFLSLHPLLQALHQHGGKLAGTVDINIPEGMAGKIGRVLATKLGVPTTGVKHDLEVTISHRNGCLHWDRCFDKQTHMISTFRAVRDKANGYWLEETGSLSMKLTVDTPDGGWHWRCLSMRVHKIRLPMWLFPQSMAYKTIENGKYRFYVGFSMPVFGTILSYSGLLNPTVSGVENG